MVGLRNLIKGALIGAAAAALVLGVWLAGALNGFEARTWDLRARLLARPGKATSQVATILLDQKSLEWGRKENALSWPWPREVYAAVADFCARGGAKALVLDVFFTEPSVYGVSDDQAMEGGVARNGRVVAVMNFGSAQATEKSWPPDYPGQPLVITGLEDWIRKVQPRTLVYPMAEFPIPELWKGAGLVANAYVAPDPSDRVFRRGPLFSMFEGRVVPAEALAAYLTGNPGHHEISVSAGLLTVDGTKVPIDEEGRAILRYRGPSTTHAAYTAAAVVQSDLQIQEGAQPALDPNVFRGRYVFYGYSAPGLFDLKPSPMTGDYPGVEIHATMLDNLLSGDFMNRSRPE